MSRVFPEDESGNIKLGEGDYGQDKDGQWHVRPPGQHAGSIPHHEVEEHEDGTITVTPSIALQSASGGMLWHGYLTKGKWKRA